MATDCYAHGAEAAFTLRTSVYHDPKRRPTTPSVLLEPTEENKKLAYGEPARYLEFEVPLGYSLMPSAHSPTKNSRRGSASPKGSSGYQRAAVTAFSRHYGWAGITPTHFWTEIVTGLAHHVYKNAASYRDVFVFGLDEIKVDNISDIENPQAARIFLAGCARGLLADGTTDLLNALFNPFSETTDTQSAVFTLGMMDVCKAFVSYSSITKCGIAEFSIGGTQDDWLDVGERLQLLGDRLNISWWTNLLLPVVARIMDTLDTQGRVADTKDLPKALQNFWDNFVKYESRSGSAEINGWINLLRPYIVTKGKGLVPLYETSCRIVEGVSYYTAQCGSTMGGRVPALVPFKQISASSKVEHLTFDYGVIACGYDKERNLLMPLLGYAVVSHPDVKRKKRHDKKAQPAAAAAAAE